MERCQQCSSRGLCLSRVKLFEKLGLDQSKSIYLSSKHEDFDKGESIFFANDKIDKIIIIRYGKVKASLFDDDGKEYIGNIYKEGDIIGDDSIFLDKNYQMNGICIEKTGLCFIDKNAIRNILVKDIDFSINMIENLSEKLYESQKLLEILSISDSYRRLGAFLIYRSSLSSNKMVELNQENIASSIHMSRETVSRKIRQLQENGYIELSTYKKIKIKNLPGLINLTNFKNL